MRKKGFTLVELIVVVTIMMVITVIGTVSFSGINKRSRDSRRMSDLEKIAIAMEIYKQENGTYPTVSSDMPSGLVSDYIDALPTDPKDYAYYYTRTDYTYYLYSHMEDVGSTTGSYENNCPSGTGCNYRISNP